jgi:hypothetical protein
MRGNRTLLALCGGELLAGPAVAQTDEGGIGLRIGAGTEAAAASRRTMARSPEPS